MIPSGEVAAVLVLSPPAKPSAPRPENLSIAGAFLGLLAFLAVALIPFLLHGGGAGVQVSSRLFGAGFAPSMAVNAFIVVCIVSAGAVMAARAEALPVAERF